MQQQVYELNDQYKLFRVGEKVEVFANRKWKLAEVIRLSPNTVTVAYKKGRGPRIVIGRVNMRLIQDPCGLSFDKIRPVDT